MTTTRWRESQVVPGAALRPTVRLSPPDDHLDTFDVVALLVAAVPSADGSVDDLESIGAQLLQPPDNESLRALLARIGLDAATLARRTRATGRAGAVSSLDLPTGAPERLLLVGAGQRAPADLRRAGAAIARGVRDGARVAIVAPHDTLRSGLAALVEGLRLGSYAYRWSSAAAKRPVREFAIRCAESDDPAFGAALRQAIDVADAVALARDLGNAPSNVKSPAWLADIAVRHGRAAGLEPTVLDPEALRERGFGGLLAVGGGSSRPPRLVVLAQPPREDAVHVVLVGKGVTFDSGGLSIKPATSMPGMKTDMSGAAAVLATALAWSDPARLRPDGIRLSVVLALAENLPGASSYRPGDVVRHFGGRTSEVINTDAEGRLVLADALAFAASSLRADVVVDIATLTGAATTALGRIAGALLTPDDVLAGQLLAAAATSGDALWRLPLIEDYRTELESPVADAVHATRDKKAGAGAILAALFLEPFAAGTAWAHLDIAGPARSDSDRHDVSRGATGYGVRLLLAWLAGLAH